MEITPAPGKRRHTKLRGSKVSSAYSFLSFWIRVSLVAGLVGFGVAWLFPSEKVTNLGTVEVSFSYVDPVIVPCNAEMIEAEMDFLRDRSCLNVSVAQNVVCKEGTYGEGGTYDILSNQITYYLDFDDNNETRGIIAHELYHAVEDQCVGMAVGYDLAEALATLYQEYRYGESNISFNQAGRYRVLVDRLPKYMWAGILDASYSKNITLEELGLVNGTTIILDMY
jgi:hypothetical protein